MNQLLLLLCQSIHAFQKERGTLCLYLANRDSNSNEQLIKAIKNSNLLLNNITSFTDSSKVTFNSEQIKSYNKLRSIFESFLNKADFRKILLKSKDVDDSVIKLLDVTPLYTHNIIIHLSYILIELALFDTSNPPSEISALSNFINWKERIGRERAIGIVGFALKEFNSEHFTRDFKILLGQQKVNERSFLALASKRQQKVFSSGFTNHKTIDEVHKQMDANKVPQVNAQNWYDLVSLKVDMMHKIEVDIIKQLDNSPSKSLQSKISKDDNERTRILDFPFFRNLSDTTINELFRLSNIKNYKKGNLLFLEGEPATRIYVVLHGWVKIYKSTADGNETVEQMLSTGNLVIESSLFSNDKYFSSGQISNDAKLLSFPASVFRNLLSKDLALALNSLKYLSQTSRSYLSQIDNNRLKSSKERVGWFLLKQFIEQKNPNTILLPFEKTIIASLLDMKPETFSRSLKSFKDSGLSTEKHQIQIKDIKVLCHYCDADLATHCHFKEHRNCRFQNNDN